MMEIALFSVVLILFFATGIVTLLGLVQIVHIEKRYLTALFSALILELVASVLYLFSHTDFFRDPYGLSVKSVVSTTEFIDLSKKNERLLQQIEDLKADNLEIEDHLKLALENNEMLAARIAELSNTQNRLDKMFLVKMASLNSMISEWGTSINFLWKPEEKTEAALVLQEAFKEIGFMGSNQNPNNDPLIAHQLLTKYKKMKGFKNTDYLTSAVVALIIQDYLTAVQ